MLIVARTIKFSLITIVLAGIHPLLAATLFVQVPGTNASRTSSTRDFLGGATGFRTYDNFQLAVGATVAQVDWWGQDGVTLPPNAFQVSFYADASGAPGLLLSTVNVSPGPGSVHSLNNKDYSATLGTPFAATGGTQYWISIFNAGPNASWAWLAAAVDGDGSIQENNVTGLRSPFIGNMSFQLDGTAVPEPSTMRMGGVALLGLVAVQLRRKG